MTAYRRRRWNGYLVGGRLAFEVCRRGVMFGDRVAGKNRKYFASQTFTASYPTFPLANRTTSIMFWMLAFHKLVSVMVEMKVQGCSDRPILLQ
ncbi:hypothetical protein K438DRAFT_1993456 [Mycena galopus ATCC 62051]|nr:hypothetical protein K438DRAFT_1993456 [Mycena galopus ATCC 62051]